MQFRVPQFIDMEDKIIGPLTLKQFGYILGAAGFTFIIWTFVPIRLIAIILIIPVAGLFLALAFVKINNRSFGELLESAFTYYTSSKLYTWKQPVPDTPPEAPKEQAPKSGTMTLPQFGLQTGEQALTDKAVDMAVEKVDQNKLHELSLGLDVLDTNSQKNTP
jgi:hypothetical protein